MDLGTTANKAPGALVSETDGKPNYPSLSLNDEVAKSFLKDNPVKLGDEVTATVKFKVSGMRSDNYGHSLTLDATSMDDIQTSGDEPAGAAALVAGNSGGQATGNEAPEDEAAAAESKILGFKRKKANSAKELPDTSAKSFLD